ncbi:hypothetical protein VB773_00300 [Haloarculaceae archaeon H-GB2-1]|nr:hypothetical protein [Haloarculaceae archaeon H-GB1-1]MEA5406171.1 hypothetical protein [Haloarculaceae archaeon H-GB2-1]
MGRSRSLASASASVTTVSLETWTLATFNVTVFSLVPILLGHLGGLLSDVLDGLGTTVGLVVFAYLWMLTLYAIRWALADGVLDGSSYRLVLRGSVAGALVGITFVLGLVAGGFLVQTVTNPADPFPIGALLLVGAIAAGVACVVGLAVGLVLSLVNLGLLRVADALVAHSSATDADGDTSTDTRSDADPTPDR